MDIDIDLAKARFGGSISAGVFVVCVLIARATDHILFWILAVAAFVAILFFNWFNRCPSCGRHLGRHHIFIEYCPYCGNPL